MVLTAHYSTIYDNLPAETYDKVKSFAVRKFSPL